MAEIVLETNFVKDWKEPLLTQSYKIEKVGAPEVIANHVRQLVSQFEADHPLKNDHSGNTYTVQIKVKLLSDLDYTISYGTSDLGQLRDFLTFFTSRV